MIKAIISCILGWVVITLPILCYFVAFRALGDLWTAYFYNNIFLYSGAAETGRVASIIQCFFEAMRNNFGFSVFMASGFVWIIIRNLKEGTLIALCCLGLIISVYFGGKAYVYYGLIFAPFAVFGLVGLANEITEFRNPKFLKRKIYPFIVGAEILILVFLSFQFSDNVYLMNYQKEDLPQYQFAEDVSKVTNATILNYGLLDMGIYLTTDTVPTAKYFCILNINLPEMWEEQNRIVENGEVDFVAARDVKLEDRNLDSSKYVLIDEAEMIFEEYVHTYYLYQRK